MSTTEKYLLGSQAPLLSTELNSLANNCTVLGAAFDDTAGQAGDGATLCDVELVVTFGAAPTANTSVNVWFLMAQDGTNYESYLTAQDATPSTTPPKARRPDVILPLDAVTTLQRIVRRVPIPWGKFKPLLKDDGTGQAFPASGSTLKLRPVSRQQV
jgi:hypothetical protein